VTRPPSPFLIVSGRHRPHEVLLLASFLLFGVVYLAGMPAPPSMARSAHWLLQTWAGGLLAGGGIGLAGCFGVRRNMARGLLLEAGGLLLSSGSLIIYVWAAIGSDGPLPLVSVGFGATIVAANLWRVWQIRADVQAVDYLP
jgi:hypothetical protein